MNQKEVRRKEDKMREEVRQACKSAWNDKQFCNVYYDVKAKLETMRELGIKCEVIVPGVTQKAVIKAVDIYDETDTEEVFKIDMYKDTQMLFVLEYHQQKKWFLAKISCKDRWNNQTVWYLEAK